MLGLCKSTSVLHGQSHMSDQAFGLVFKVMGDLKLLYSWSKSIVYEKYNSADASLKTMKWASNSVNYNYVWKEWKG